LNLTAADHVILVEPWWNPAVEAQAIDRAHRIGQSSPVTASRLIARGTVEERIQKLQTTKRELMASAVEDDPLTLPGLTDDDLEGLLE
jgi:SNF2 family DNA or RNA helicase